jgi:hypothetical protein
MANRIPWPKYGERQYRIVTDKWAGFEVQFRTFWNPFWRMPNVNTSRTLQEAEELAQRIESRYCTKGVVKYLGVLTPKD